ncbi:MAG: hypothetical protein M1814_005078 [Vezdaea aestivalis]|nr:MAG: hypothetical protein M1814_005078 [Vezdaea aestivalis]
MPESRNEALLEFWSNFRIQRLADPQRGSLRYTPFQQAIFTPQTREINVLLGREAWPNGDGPGYGSRVALQRPPSWYSSILRCRGDLPRGPWPPPFDNINPQDQDEYSRHRTFRDVTAICAAHWFGGDVRGNAGMVCRKSISGRFKLKQEPYLAHPALYRENPRGGIFIDFWCHRACDCPTTDEEKQRPLKNKISVAELTGVDNGMVIFHPSGSILVARQESRKTTLYRVAPWTPEQTAACLSTDPQEECPSSDQIDAIILSDLMKEAPDPTFPAAEVVAKVKPKTCGRSCTGPSDCSQADDCGSCVFHPDFRAIHASGLSPFIPLAAAMCLTLASGNRGRLNGRDFGIKSDLSDVICACNATYVSQGCCRAAPSGIVHEDFRPGAASVNLLKL